MADTRTHLDEAELLRYCDGELSAGDVPRVEQHMQHCEDCRSRLDNLRQTFAAYAHYQREEAVMPSPPEPWHDLRSEFALMEQRRPAWRRPLHRPAVWWVACAATAGTGIWFYTFRAPRVAMPAAVDRPTAIARPAPPSPAIPPMVRERSVNSGDELRVMAALHRLGADLGDPIEVARTSKEIVVTCSGLPAERFAQVAHALAGIPGVTVKSLPKPATTPYGSSLDVVGAPHTNDDEQLADNVLHHSDAIMTRAHALRALAVRFPAPVESVMNAESRNLLTSIRQDHEAELSREVDALAALLGPPAPAGPVDGAWQERAARIFADAEQVDRLLGARFAGHGSNPANDPSGSLAAALARLQADVR